MDQAQKLIDTMGHEVADIIKRTEHIKDILHGAAGLSGGMGSRTDLVLVVLLVTFPIVCLLVTFFAVWRWRLARRLRAATGRTAAEARNPDDDTSKAEQYSKGWIDTGGSY